MNIPPDRIPGAGASAMALRDDADRLRDHLSVAVRIVWCADSIFGGDDRIVTPGGDGGAEMIIWDRMIDPDQIGATEG